jgi:hypothetical protein
VIGTQLHVLGVHHPYILFEQLANIASKLLAVFINIQTHHHLCRYYLYTDFVEKSFRRVFNVSLIENYLMMYSFRTINLSVDIEKIARELIRLLEKASKFQQQWHQSPILKQMITRYYRFMQLKA